MTPPIDILAINLTDPIFLGSAAVAVLLVGYVVATVARQGEASPSTSSGGANPQDVAQAKQTFQDRKEAAEADEPGETEKPSIGPGRGRTLAEMAASEEINEAELLSRFVHNASGDTVGETMALDEEEVILKRDGGFYALSMDTVIEKDGMLLVDAKVDWDDAEEAGEEWRKANLDEMEYDDEGMPVVD